MNEKASCEAQFPLDTLMVANFTIVGKQEIRIIETALPMGRHPRSARGRDSGVGGLNRPRTVVWSLQKGGEVRQKELRRSLLQAFN